jgi:O-antigen/teichoic acid export membrane protein
MLRVVSLMATTLAAFFLMPFLVHKLGDRNYGYWALVGAVLSYYGVLDFGIVSAVEFYVARALGDEDTRSANRAIVTSFFTFTLIGVLVLLVTIVLAFFAKHFIATPADASLFRRVLVIMGIGVAVGFPGRAFLGAISAHLRWDLISLIGIVVLTVRTLLTVVVVVAGGGLVSIAMVALSGEILSYGLYYLILRKILVGFKISLAYASFTMLKELFHYSSYAFILQISNQMRFFVDGWMVGVFVGVSAVTHYAIASRISLSFMSLLIAALGILSPWFSQLLGKADFDSIRRVFGTGTKISASLSTVILFAVILYSHAFIDAWMGKRYEDAYLPLILLLSAIFADVSQLPSGSYLLGVSRHRFLALVTLTEALANFGLSIFWARRYGMIGVALGTLVPMLVAKLFIQPVYVCRQIKISISSYYFGLFGRSIAIPALLSVGVWALALRRLCLPNLASVCAVIIAQFMIVSVFTFFLLFDKDERGDALKKLMSLFGPGRRSQPAEYVPPVS